MKIYAFKYTSCIYESAFETISLHKSKETAEVAMNKYVAKRRKEHDSLWKGDEDGDEYKLEDFEAWEVQEMEVID